MKASHHVRMNVEITELTQSKSQVILMSHRIPEQRARAKGTLGFTMSSLLQNFLSKATHPSYTVIVFGKLIAHTQQCFRGFYSWQLEQNCPPYFRLWKQSTVTLVMMTLTCPHDIAPSVPVIFL